jgi:hypothetical protein
MLPMQTILLSNSIFFMVEGAIVSATIQGNTNDLEALKEIIRQML